MKWSNSFYNIFAANAVECKEGQDKTISFGISFECIYRTYIYLYWLHSYFIQIKIISSSTKKLSCCVFITFSSYMLYFLLNSYSTARFDKLFLNFTAFLRGNYGGNLEFWRDIICCGARPYVAVVLGVILVSCARPFNHRVYEV